MVKTAAPIIEQLHDNLTKVITEKVEPYLGCTDISVIALGSALATQAAYGFVPDWIINSTIANQIRKVDPKDIVSIDVQVNESLFKNSHATAIPNTGHYGIHKSAALGAFSDPQEKLNLFTSISDSNISKMLATFENSKVTVKTVKKPFCNLYLHSRVTIIRGDESITGEAILENGYTNVKYLKRNGKLIFSKVVNNGGSINDNSFDIPLDIPELLSALDLLTDEAFEKLEETVKLNTEAYKFGIKHGPGLGVGKKLDGLIQLEVLGDDVANNASAKTAGAEDVRMGGASIPVMGIASSGSHGIAASIPIIAVAEKMQKEPRKLLEAIALSFWITTKINSLIGTLSAPCGCVVKSGIGASAGITYYMGGTVHQIEQAINNFIVSNSMIICDGGKTTCALKLANSSSSVVKSAFLALAGLELSDNDGGIVRENFEKNIDNMVTISKAMEPVDSAIVDILLEYQQK
ncbi:MAG: L-serine ammonia-lyase, iron-sulfur-dependent, subunit alpha [Candidatus Kariarchaeaceae archaeon]|jgi:L-cysteine desulfidase